ncbi:MAG: DNA polymerase III subunit gamma/tau [Limnochordaceae bacterium]|nr:DNA polymerase III subunit gamma/tau [Limnochordaceae bacterium]
MPYLSLYRKWRPQSFDEVIGQPHVVRTLQNALRTGRVAHAYLFAGPRGTGKTTVARLLAKGLNCQKGMTPDPCLQCASCRRIAAGNSLDCLEIDGASNRGIDEIRELRERSKFAPQEGKFKIYIIDEAHMLTTEAFNALLKTLEEPPEHVVFVLATTEAHKIPPTIVSRCQRFDFHRFGNRLVVQHLQKVCASEGVQASPEALQLIARHAEGGLRDALGLLDQCLAYVAEPVPEPSKSDTPMSEPPKPDTVGRASGATPVLDQKTVEVVLGLVPDQVLAAFLTGLYQGDLPTLTQIVEEVFSSGADIRQFVRRLARELQAGLVSRFTAGAAAHAYSDGHAIAGGRVAAPINAATTGGAVRTSATGSGAAAAAAEAADEDQAHDLDDLAGRSVCPLPDAVHTEQVLDWLDTLNDVEVQLRGGAPPRFTLDLAVVRLALGSQPGTATSSAALASAPSVARASTSVATLASVTPATPTSTAAGLRPDSSSGAGQGDQALAARLAELERREAELAAQLRSLEQRLALAGQQPSAVAQAGPPAQSEPMGRPIPAAQPGPVTELQPRQSRPGTPGQLQSPQLATGLGPGSQLESQAVTVRDQATQSRPLTQPGSTVVEPPPPPPPQHQPVATQARPGAMLAIEQVQAEWPSVLQLARQRSPELYALLREASPDALTVTSGGETPALAAHRYELHLVFPEVCRFHKMSLERPAERSVLERVLTRQFHYPIRAVCHLGTLPASLVAAQGQPGPTSGAADAGDEARTTLTATPSPLVDEEGRPFTPEQQQLIAHPLVQQALRLFHGTVVKVELTDEAAGSSSGESPLEDSQGA